MKSGRTALLYLAAFSAVLVLTRTYLSFDAGRTGAADVHKTDKEVLQRHFEETTDEAGAGEYAGPKNEQKRPVPMVVPWSKHLSYLDQLPGVLAIQVGPGREDMAKWLLDNVLTHKTSHLICVDLFNNQMAYDSFIKKLGSTKDKVTVWKGRNVDALLDTVVTSRRYDFMYLDCHGKAAKTVMTEICLMWPLVRSFGVIVLDNHLWGSGLKDSPKPAVDAFIRWFRNDTTVLHNEKQVVLRKNKTF